MWIAAHPSNTMKVRCPDVEGAPTFELGFWPPRVSERVNTALAAIRKAQSDEDFLDPGSPEFGKITDLNFDITVEMLRWGVRGWEGADLTPAVVSVEKVDGIDHPRLSLESAHVLSVNGVHNDLAQKAWLFNILTEQQKKTFGLRLPSVTSRSLTDVPSATAPGKVSKLEGCSVSTVDTSKAAQ